MLNLGMDTWMTGEACLQQQDGIVCHGGDIQGPVTVKRWGTGGDPAPVLEMTTSLRHGDEREITKPSAIKVRSDLCFFSRDLDRVFMT